ncbi:UDP-N-acetylmuramate dehydrogenase [Natranaerobius trueperi]|uniref:UDP-N-acetylenolpyruvoylglucosamine reductase n=1 Tax=Natranaerobius trueperi TaxID=759412 RepID=A0A226C033_9FIRM|nr:UDP-N-acetylmuramate dehydrogenase [Natranaerobius trueperi]OWZ83954.1 UDP-N-acetylenolpyruvoylglucosamine reductase [Natranaerobius trueperi]
MSDIINQLKKGIAEDNIKINHSLASYTTFKIGGPADIFLSPSKIEEIEWALEVAKKEDINYYVLGNGSNVLIDDQGLRGMVIYLGENYTDVKVNGTNITAQSGVSLKELSLLALENNLTGLEFAVGIPGTLGGGVYMNAGAYGGQLGDAIEEVVCIVQGNIKTYQKDSIEFGYRSSTFQKEGAVILEGVVSLDKDKHTEIKKLMDDFTQRREDKQPVEMASAGSVFKRPEGYYAGKLIQDSGLKGHKIGGAQVSTKHCGFIVNIGNASSNDVKKMIQYIQQTVKAKFGVSLERELRYLG